ncbi:MAG: hypothetical protein QOG15_2775 [Solirubrobacteraceae bacterium]|jgi:hypothetical protein|nr:hypothetical protein [Solirubrobacteraceae bacterium]
MGRESANYWVALPSDAEPGVARALEQSGAELLADGVERLDYCLRDPNRYWIDLRIHRRPSLRLEIRIALTNDTWAIRVPIDHALTPLPPEIDGEPVLDDDGETVAVAGEERWLYALEQDYGRLRDEFVARFGDFFAPIPTDSVYTFIHQARKRRDVSEALAEQREMEVELLEDLWEISPPAGEEDDALREPPG